MPVDPNHSRNRLNLKWFGSILLLLFLIACGMWYSAPSTRERAQRDLSAARNHYKQRDYVRAEQFALEALRRDPELDEARLIAAESAAEQGHFETATSIAEQFADAQSAIAERIHMLSSSWNQHELMRFTEAENDLRLVLKSHPDNVEAMQRLAVLLGISGRRYEAIPFVLNLLRFAQPSDLIIMVGQTETIVTQPGFLEKAIQVNPDDPNILLGLAWHASHEGRRSESIELLRKAEKCEPKLPYVQAALMDNLAHVENWADLGRVNKALPDAADRFPEVWLARAKAAQFLGDRKGAIRCYLEASQRSPELNGPYTQLATLFYQLGKPEISARFEQRILELEQFGTFQAQFEMSVDSVLQLTTKLESLGRIWEAYGWCLLVAPHVQSEPILNRLSRLQAEVGTLPLVQTAEPANVALHVDLSEYPLPDLSGLDAVESQVDSSSSYAETEIAFQKQNRNAGFDFRYFHGEAGPTRKMYGLTGGGIGVLDFDCDGTPDVFLTQGRNWPPETADVDHSDQLYRNLNGDNFQNVTTSAGLHDSDFGQGTSCGDINGDGFPDVYVGNIGSNAIWINNGDGTFSNVTATTGMDSAVWTTSCLIADVSGDGLPDLYDVNYLKGDDIFDRVCEYEDGVSRQCMPFEFQGETDRLWINLGDGRFEDATETALTVDPNHNGLGIVAWDADRNGKLDLYVANDLTPNFFYRNESNDSTIQLREAGLLSGLALNADGRAEGSMGIAIADADNDGEIDLYVTHFLQESNTLYMNRGGIFVDETVRQHLEQPTLNSLGFGTQFLDVNLDGTQELFVSNGHVDDLTHLGKPYRMKPQWFARRGRRWEIQADVTEGYFKEEWLGRAVAKIDWNRDRRPDLLIGHLIDDYALLTNSLDTKSNAISLKLVGRVTNRDAIGTTVRIHIGDEQLVHQLTAGGGYQASNEHRLIIGTGKAAMIDRLTVEWPSGEAQHFEDVSGNADYLLRESDRLMLLP